MEKLLTAYELAEILNLSVETIWRYTRQKKIPVIELGDKQYRYQRAAVLAALAGGNNASADAVREDSPVYAKQGEYTYEDYLKLQEEPGCRYEILEGWLVKEPSPSVQHQRVAASLYRQLAISFDQFDPEGEVFFAPLDVTLTNKNVVQPDLLFISGARRGIMRRERIDGPCDLVVEIISPSNRRKDRLQKMEIYRKAGIPHFWLVDPEDETLEAFLLKDAHYALIFSGGPGDHFQHPAFPGLELDLDKVFYRPPEGPY
jgi:excisionase family DNA binding protein